MLAPIADKLGIDLIWFGVLLCVNMQTSFMHPPFGFALFYLRGIAPPSVKSKDIYWGAIPWVGLQILLVIVVIFWPESVTYWLDQKLDFDPDKVEIVLPPSDAPAGATDGPQTSEPETPQIEIEREDPAAEEPADEAPPEEEKQD
jgi:hypothetical protein